MAAVKVLAGDFRHNSGNSFMFGIMTLMPKSSSMWALAGKSYKIKTDIRSASIADEAHGIKVFGAAKWATVGAVVAGPVGAIIGGILGGSGSKVVFVAEFTDGNKLMAQVDKDVWLKIQAAQFGK
jgi:hypothetical protein